MPIQQKRLVKYKASFLGPKWGNRIITYKKGLVIVTCFTSEEINGKVHDWIKTQIGPDFTLISLTTDIIPEI